MSKLKFKRKYLSIPYALFLIFFVVLPLLLIIYYAFSDASGNLSFKNFIEFFGNKNKIRLLSVSAIIGALNTVFCILIAYPIAMILVNKKFVKSTIIVMLFIMPMWINFVLRTAATRDLLYAIGIEGGNYPYAVTMIGMVYNYLPFAILPLYSTMLKMDKNLIEASYDLGANKRQTFVKTIIPMTMPGIISAAQMVFMPTMSSYVIPETLSEGKIVLFGNSIYLGFANNQWNSSSFMAIIMLIIIGISMLATRNFSEKDSGKGGTAW